jgi:Phage portal protein
VGLFREWFDGLVAAPVPPAAVRAAAGTVTVAATPGRVPWGVDSEHFLPFDFSAAIAADWWGRDAAMSLPTISRARDLICSLVGALPFTLWKVDLTAVPAVEQQIPGRGWMDRPDPARTRQWLLAWTVDDLLFYGVAHWQIVDRYADTYPARFTRIPPGDLHVDATSGRVTVNGTEVRPVDIVQFDSPLESLLANGYRAISIALQLDAAADRFAGTEVPAGILEEQDGSEDMSSDELGEQAATFTAARRSNTTAALNKYLRYRESTYDPSRMQLVEGRTYQALELARLGNVPPYLVGAPAGTGMTYQNALQAKGDLIDFGAGPFIGCIEQTLSGPNVTPRGQTVRLDQNAWLRNPFTTPPDAEASPNDLQIADPTTAPGPPSTVVPAP